MLVNDELRKRIVTSFSLIFILIFMYLSNFFLLYILIIGFILTLFEFFKIVSKIYKDNKIYSFLFNSIFALYLSIYIIYFFLLSLHQDFKLLIFFILAICISSDIGGLIIGRYFKGPKLIKISPKKTISGAIGSLFFSSINSVVLGSFILGSNKISSLIIFGFFISIICQLGDLFFSFLKRKSKLKHTGKTLPGHGGILDRIDGILFGLPLGLFLFPVIFI